MGNEGRESVKRKEREREREKGERGRRRRKGRGRRRKERGERVMREGEIEKGKGDSRVGFSIHVHIHICTCNFLYYWVSGVVLKVPANASVFMLFLYVFAPDAHSTYTCIQYAVYCAINCMCS